MTLRRVDATIFACWICDFNVDKEFSSWIVDDTAALLLVDDNEAFVDVVVAVAEGAAVEDDGCPRNLPRDFGASDFDGDEEEEAAAAAGAERNLPRRGAAPDDPSVVFFGGAIVSSEAGDGNKCRRRFPPF